MKVLGGGGGGWGPTSERRKIPETGHPSVSSILGCIYVLCRFVGCMEEANVLEIGQLGNRVACDIIQTWLRKARRHLTNFQVFEV